MSFRSSSTSRQPTGYLPPSSPPATHSSRRRGRLAGRSWIPIPPWRSSPGTTDATWFDALQRLPTLPALGPGPAPSPLRRRVGVDPGGASSGRDLHPPRKGLLFQRPYSGRAGGDPELKGAGIIDAHAHVFRPAAISPRGVDRVGASRRDASVGDLLERMAGSGVDAAVLVPPGRLRRLRRHSARRIPQDFRRHRRRSNLPSCRPGAPAACRACTPGGPLRLPRPAYPVARRARAAGDRLPGPAGSALPRRAVLLLWTYLPPTSCRCCPRSSASFPN